MKRTAISLLCILFISCGEDITTQPQPTEIKRTYFHAYNYAPNFFFVDTAYMRIYEEIMSQPDFYYPIWVEKYRIKEIEVWEDVSGIQSGNGIAFANLEPKQLRLGQNYDPELKNTPIESGVVERGRFLRLDTSKYSVHLSLGFVSIYNMNKSHNYAIAYRTEGPTNAPEDDYYHGTLSTAIGVNDTLLLKLIYSPNMRPEYKTLWNRKMKNVYSVFEQNIDISNTDIKIFYIGPVNDTLEFINNLPDKLVTILRVDKRDNITGQTNPDGIFDLVLPYFDAREGLIMFPSMEPFRDGLRQYFEKMGMPQEAEQYVYHEVYDTTYDAAKMNADKDKFLIMFETRE